jgi:hypothetical protein
LSTWTALPLPSSSPHPFPSCECSLSSCLCVCSRLVPVFPARDTISATLFGMLDTFTFTQLIGEMQMRDETGPMGRVDLPNPRDGKSMLPSHDRRER